MLSTFTPSKRYTHPLLIIPSILALNLVDLREIVLRYAWSTKLELEVAYRSARRISIIESLTSHHFLFYLLLWWDMQSSGIRHCSLTPFLIVRFSHSVLVCRLKSHFFKHLFCRITYIPHLLIKIILSHFSKRCRSLKRGSFLRTLNYTLVSERALSFLEMPNTVLFRCNLKTLSSPINDLDQFFLPTTWDVCINLIVDEAVLVGRFCWLDSFINEKLWHS